MIYLKNTEKRRNFAFTAMSCFMHERTIWLRKRSETEIKNDIANEIKKVGETTNPSEDNRKCGETKTKTSNQAEEIKQDGEPTNQTKEAKKESDEQSTGSGTSQV
eukprot:g71462.t1